MTVVEVFKTNVPEQEQAGFLIDKLVALLPLCKINFDLQDCDKILRVEGKVVPCEKIIELVTNNGFHCQSLE